MRDGGEVLVTLTGNVGDADVPIIIGNLIAQATGDRKAAIEGGTHLGTEGGSVNALGSIGNGRMGDERGDVANHALPNILDIRVDARGEIICHVHHPSSAVQMTRSGSDLTHCAISYPYTPSREAISSMDRQTATAPAPSNSPSSAAPEYSPMQGMPSAAAPSTSYLRSPIMTA